MAKDSPEEAMEVTRARRLEKYWARMVTVGRKERQKPNPKERRKRKRGRDSHWPATLHG